MKLEMVKGRESSLIIEDVIKSITQEGFLADSYTKALRALCDYVEHTDLIRKELSGGQYPSARNSILYRSPQNIIAFSGKRGSGKSSSMLSFSDVLGDARKWSDLCACPAMGRDYSELKNRRFVVIDPIDPTTLEANQSILSVILSRLLFMAEGEWSQHISFYGGFQDKESKKTELLTLARRCLNGIRAIKGNEKIPQDLSDLQRVGDSSILKKNLFDFVELFLQFCNTDPDSFKAGQMLVLQIDDTDCQISQGHETMEDIRKYLTIPNVLILMATDTKLLRQVLTQHYVSDFSDDLRVGLVKVEEIRHLGEKYLAKLMPPPHVIHLPNIDEIIRDKTDLIHVFYYEDETKRSDNLLNLYGEENYEDYNFQSVILRYIYRKTHIVFTTHDAYANNIIPTTLRGLAYLLSQLSSMEDVPEIDLRHEPFTPEYLADRLQAQFAVLERNLNLFEGYFLHDWIQAKLPQKKVDIVEKLSGQALDQRVPFIMKELETHYQHTHLSWTYDYNTVTYADLDEQLRIIQGTHKSHGEIQFRQMEDFYFIFAIRTLLTIKNNRDVLRAKRREVGRFDPTEGENLVFDYLKGKTSLPTGFYLDAAKLYGYQLVSETGIKNGAYADAECFAGEADRALFRDLYLDSGNYSAGAERRFNFMGSVVKWLDPQEEDCRGMSQREVFIAQEAAVLVAANCDVQEVARKAVAREARVSPQPRSAGSFSEAIRWGLSLAQDAVANINLGMLAAYRPEGEDKTAWKISPRLEAALNGFYPVMTAKAKKPLFRKFEAQIPEQYYPPSIYSFEHALADYMAEVNKTISAQNRRPSKRIQAAQRMLREFEFEGKDGLVKNGDELSGLLEELYAALDEKFPGEVDGWPAVRM